jgi:serpin B
VNSSKKKKRSTSQTDNVWPQQNFPVLPGYISTLQTSYDAGVTALNYSNPAGAAQTIDGAVSQETDGYIPQLVTPSDLSGAALVLTNAIFFKANWLSHFATLGTNQQTFTLPSGATESVSMMHENLGATIGNYNGAASVIALPYTNNGAAMCIFLPPPGGMSNLESLMTGSNINSWLAANATAMTGSTGGPVALSLPKFTFSTSYSLKNTFISLGMPLAFAAPGPSGANFSGIDGNLDLTIGKVIHQAFIDVTETGTTAAATAVIVVTINGSFDPPHCLYAFYRGSSLYLHDRGQRHQHRALHGPGERPARHRLNIFRNRKKAPGAPGGFFYLAGQACSTRVTQ